MDGLDLAHRDLLHGDRILIVFTILAIRYPETPRRGILLIETTRGDRSSSRFSARPSSTSAGSACRATCRNGGRSASARSMPRRCSAGYSPLTTGRHDPPAKLKRFNTREDSMNLMLRSTTALGVALAAMTGAAHADMEAARAFLDAEIGDLSVLTREEQEAEMQWFIDAAAPLAGMSINVVSETITTHEYEARVLAPAFSAITGINVTHDLIGEGDVVERLQTQMQTGENIYDMYINDADLIGTHWRYQQVRNMTDWMAGEGADFTNPDLDLDDFIGLSFGHRPRRQALPASRPAVRQPLLVPPRLVHRPRDHGRFPRGIRLRPGRAGQLVGL
jgi:hypothetical protein